MKVRASYCKAGAIASVNANIQRIIHPSRTIVNNRPQAIAQRKAQEAAIVKGQRSIQRLAITSGLASVQTSVIQRNVFPVGDVWDSTENLSNQRFESQLAAEMYEQGLVFTKEQMSEKTTIEPIKERDIVIGYHVRTSWGTLKNYSESKGRLTSFENIFLNSGEIQFIGNYRMSPKQTRFFASDVLKYQRQRVSEMRGQAKAQPITVVRRVGIINTDTLHVIQDEAFKTLSVIDKINRFYATPNGKSTKHILDAEGYQAVDLVVSDSNEDVTITCAPKPITVQLPSVKTTMQLPAIKNATKQSGIKTVKKKTQLKNATMPSISKLTASKTGVKLPPLKTHISSGGKKP